MIGCLLRTSGIWRRLVIPVRTTPMHSFMTLGAFQTVLAQSAHLMVMDLGVGISVPCDKLG